MFKFQRTKYLNSARNKDFKISEGVCQVEGTANSIPSIGHCPISSSSLQCLNITLIFVININTIIRYVIFVIKLLSDERKELYISYISETLSKLEPQITIYEAP